jgi:tRNA threonylcarbamoyladenosine biosynthesis protein TsaE
MSASTESILAQRNFSSLDEPQLLAWIQQIAPSFRGGAVMYLDGDLGAGKTTTARALIQSLGHRGRVKSPTYSLFELYELADLTVAHLDLYRLADAAEVLDLGLEELGSDQACLMLVEWSEKGGEYLAKPDIVWRLSVNGELRALKVSAISARGAAIMATWPSDLA